MLVWAHLSLSNVFHREVEPHSEPRVTRVRPDEQIKLKFTDVVNTAQVTYGETVNNKVVQSYFQAMNLFSSSMIHSTICIQKHIHFKTCYSLALPCRHIYFHTDSRDWERFPCRLIKRTITQLGSC